MKNIGWKEFSYFMGIYALIFVMQSLVGYFSMESIEGFYANLQRAPWSPPNWLFGPAWTFLYVLISLSIWLVYLTNTKKEKNKAYVVFFVQLILNAMWSPLFFFLQSPLLSLICIVALLVLIGINIYYFYRINKIAALILLPYLFWVFFATSLNIYIVLMN